MRKVIRRNHTLRALADFPVRVTAMPVIVCQRCGAEMLDGADLERVRQHLASHFLASPNRLGSEEARYLRKSLLLTQAELAKRIGITRVTVARWETGNGSISPQNDFILRGLVLAQLLRSGSVRAEVAAASLGAVHTAEPRPHRGPVVLRDAA